MKPNEYTISSVDGTVLLNGKTYCIPKGEDARQEFERAFRIASALHLLDVYSTEAIQNGRVKVVPVEPE